MKPAGAGISLYRDVAPAREARVVKENESPPACAWVCDHHYERQPINTTAAVLRGKFEAAAAAAASSAAPRTATISSTASRVRVCF